MQVVVAAMALVTSV
jgi:hypothetical protein